MAVAPDEPSSTTDSLQVSTLAEDVENELICAICLSRYNDPRLLPCLHTYCKECLEKCLKTEKEKHGCNQITCPQCKEVHKVADEGVETFSSYFTINNLLELLNVHEANLEGRKAKAIHCSIGLDENPAVARCSTCCCYLCEPCWINHTRMVPTKSHSVVTLDQIKSYDKQSGTRALQEKRYCPEHEDQLLRLYCRTCKEVICQACALVKHPSSRHNCAFVKDVQSEVIEELQKLSKNTQAKEKELSTYCDYIKEVRSTNVTSLEATEKQVNEAFDRLKEVMEARRLALITELRNTHAQEQKRVDAETQSMELTLGKVKSTINFVQQLLDNGSDVEVISVSEQAKKNMTRLNNVCWDKDANGPSLMCVKLSAQMESDLSKYGSLVTELQPEDIIIADVPDDCFSGEEFSCNIRCVSDELVRRHYRMPKPNISLTHATIIGITRPYIQASVQCTRTSEVEWKVLFVPHAPNLSLTMAVLVNTTKVQNSPLQIRTKAKTTGTPYTFPRPGHI